MARERRQLRRRFVRRAARRAQVQRPGRAEEDPALRRRQIPPLPERKAANVRPRPRPRILRPLRRRGNLPTAQGRRRPVPELGAGGGEERSVPEAKGERRGVSSTCVAALTRTSTSG